MGKQGKVTIYDLAKRLNTTASTVSRALSGNTRISKKMRDAVQKLAQELNYAPDPIAHHLRTGRGSALGIVVPRIDRNFFAGIISAFQETAQRQNYNVIIAASNENVLDETTAIRALLAKKVDGIAVSLSVETIHPSYEVECGMRNTPLVYFDRVPQITESDTVSNDNFQIGYDATMQLARKGCKRIGHFAGPQTLKSYVDRLEGYKKALADLGFPFRKEWVFENTITLETGTEVALRIMEMEEKPDGIFAAGDFSAIAAMDTFISKGLKVPNDIAVVGVANESLDPYLKTPLASIDLHQQRIGELAAKMLLMRINKADNEEMRPPQQRVIVKHDIILRESIL